MNFFSIIKQYSTMIIVGAVLASVLSLASYILVIKSQRDTARAQLATAQALIEDYKRASEASKRHAAELMALAESNEIANADEISKLKAQVAQSDEEARRMAIAAGKVIGGLK